MKTAILSDIHGHAVALETVLRELDRQDIDQLIVLGDLAYRGPEPKRCIELIRLSARAVIGGNADEWAVRGVRAGEVPDHVLLRMNEERSFTVDHIADEDIAYLSSLPMSATFDLGHGQTLYACHAAPSDRFQVVLPNTSDEDLAALYLTEDQKEPSIAAYGHIHIPYIRSLKGATILNPGSVGLPFDGNPKASYAVIETSANTMNASIHRVTYDLRLALEALERLDYPHRERLAQSMERAAMP